MPLWGLWPCDPLALNLPLCTGPPHRKQWPGLAGGPGKSAWEWFTPQGQVPSLRSSRWSLCSPGSCEVREMAQLLANDGDKQPIPTAGRHWSGQCSQFSNTRTRCGLEVWCTEAGAKVNSHQQMSGLMGPLQGVRFLGSVSTA